MEKKYNNEDGVWRTIGGRKVFIRNGQSLSDAMKESGKFKNLRKDYRTAKEKKLDIDVLDEKAMELYKNDDEKGFEKFNDNELKELAKLTQITEDNPGGRAYDDEVWNEMDRRGLSLDKEKMDETNEKIANHLDNVAKVAKEVGDEKNARTNELASAYARSLIKGKQYSADEQDILDRYGEDYGYDKDKSNLENLKSQIDYMRNPNESINQTAQRLVGGGDFLIYNGDIKDWLDERGIKYNEDNFFEVYKKEMANKIEKLYNEWGDDYKAKIEQEQHDNWLKDKFGINKENMSDEQYNRSLNNYREMNKAGTELNERIDKEKQNDFHYAGEELYSYDPNRFGDTLRNYNEKMNPTNYYATGNTYWNGQGKYKDYVSSIENLTDEELVKRGIPKSLVKEYRNEAYKYYRWFNDGDKPHMKTLDGKSYASAEYLSKGINSKNERDYWNEVYGNDMETRVNNILDRMQQAEVKNKQDKFYTRKDGAKEYDPYKGTPYEKKYDGIDDVIKDPSSALNKYINEKEASKNSTKLGNQEDELSKLSGGAISILKTSIPQNKQDRIKQGVEIYYKGDQANTPGYFTIESFDPSKEQFLSSITLKEKGGEGRTKKISAQQIEDEYTNNYASRFSFKEDYDNYRNSIYEKYAQMSKKEEPKTMNDKIRNEAYRKYMKEHPNSKMTLEQFLKKK